VLHEPWLNRLPIEQLPPEQPAHTSGELNSITATTNATIIAYFITLLLAKNALAYDRQGQGLAEHV